MLLVSRHGDAEFLAAAAEQWGYQLVRGSTTRGGATAVRAVMRAVSAGRDAAMTPDGPRGPAHVVKPGLLWTARQTGAAIIPVGVAASSSTRLRSWDGFSIPRPGARVAVRYAAPIVPDWSDADDGARVVAAGLQHAEREAQCMV